MPRADAPREFAPGEVVIVVGLNEFPARVIGPTSTCCNDHGDRIYRCVVLGGRGSEASFCAAILRRRH